MWRSICKPWNYPKKNDLETIFRIPETFGRVISSIPARPLVGAADELPTGNREFVYCPRNLQQNAVARFSSEWPINFKYHLGNIHAWFELNLEADSRSSIFGWLPSHEPQKRGAKSSLRAATATGLAHPRLLHG
jgi:hypothetical protein